MKKFFTLILIISGISIYAGGFQLNVQSARALGLGGAYSGYCFGAESVFFNPAGLSNLKGHNFTLGGSYIMPLVALQTPTTNNILQTSPNSTPIHFYYGGQIVDNLFVGFSVNNQFGSTSSFEEDWEGRYIIQNIALKTFTYQPTVTYKVHDYISVGAGFMITTGNFAYEKAIPVGSASTDEGKAKLSGKGLAFGFNVGLFSKPIDNDKMKLTIGASFRSGQKISLEDGVAEFSDIPLSLQSTFPSQTNFTGALNLPFVLSTGFAYTYKIKADHGLTLVYDFNYTGWSSYDTLAFDFENEDTPDSKTTKDWQNSPTQRFGLEYNFKEKLFFRVGGYYDVSPVKDGYVSPELPDITQFVPTVGFGVSFTENIGLDIAYIHQDATRSSSLDEAGFTANYHRIADVITFNLSIKF